ncbi:arginyl-tRNA--protein transferase 1-like [Saccoglossus kowalevskii]|uniref:Arginyl-tRNA--protein transferase 1 n=1 Tax=Saccoglossus kowalevskii TaxID=10224 RepID=A0ABM0LZW1_SACKO|nr:PREDICTED: arginyl-tRNA--protein transferase 1-like [Saccoglossus kowalevskii]
MATSVVEYFTEHDGHRCGYCGSKDSNYSRGMWAHSLTCEDYEDLIDRGCRRSGKYVYKPTMDTMCCPSYTIRHKALEFKISKSQKKVLKKVTKYLTVENSGIDKKQKDDSSAAEVVSKEKTPGDDRTKLETERRNCNKTSEDNMDGACVSREQIKTSPPSVNVKPQFTRFLVDSPLEPGDEDDSLEHGYGSFHQQYWLDGVLIAVGVIDILPHCVSSVYLYYDPDYSFMSLGTYSGLQEIAFTRSLQKKAPSLKYYYMGYYIHTCPKMRYKGQYYPSFLLCPEAYTWVTLEKCTPKLDVTPYAKLDDSHAVDEPVDTSQVMVLHQRQAMPYMIYRAIKRNTDDHQTVEQYAKIVGNKFANNVLLYRA